jgi:hypothetical protein
VGKLLPTYDSISYLQQIAIGLKNLGYTFVSPTAAEANRVIRELLPKLSNESHE